MAFVSWLETARDKALIIAHRGGAALGPENSALAFSLAGEAGADAVETDVRVSADGMLVCLHDADMQRIAGDPRSVEALDLKTLKDLVPDLLTLEAAIAASAPLGILLDVKLTDSTHLAEIVRTVEAAGASRRAILGLRNMGLIAEVRSIGCEMAILGLLPDADSSEEAAELGADWFRLWQGEASPDRIATARKAGLQVAIMVGQPRNVPLPEYPQFAVGLVDAEGLEKLHLLAPDAIMLDDPRLL
ncbi:glycerophosphodiester phosphodiesterase [Rhizobium tumorigenes]|uniref:glycerophosphodiester phosphodiesterase n=1 Tax=Rhizobium tumorigenes TaxID=2041385 RepID=UPI00241FFF21|nr:glycerophosphodiester phosphodiesterase [Rhizobium tumorigenes]WFS02604.1 glycerophosphodiester phosphodiesterase [Rhizobium tumorigenes]